MNKLPSAEKDQSPIRVLLLDYHTLVRQGIRLLLEGFSDIEVVGEAGSSEQALKLTEKLAPDVILLELNLDGELNTEIVPELLSSGHQVKIILVTALDEKNIYQMAIQMGALGIVQKTENGTTLLKAIRKVHSGEVWIDRSMMAKLLTRITRAQHSEENDYEAVKIASLSAREREVICLVGQGLKNKEIADRLSISEVTVRHHLTTIYSKLEVSNRLELAIFAYRNGLAELPT